MMRRVSDGEGKRYKGPVEESAMPARNRGREAGYTKWASTLPAPADYKMLLDKFRPMNWGTHFAPNGNLKPESISGEYPKRRLTYFRRVPTKRFDVFLDKDKSLPLVEEAYIQVLRSDTCTGKLHVILGVNS
jgi:hypothetical protein